MLVAEKQYDLNLNEYNKNKERRKRKKPKKLSMAQKVKIVTALLIFSGLCIGMIITTVQATIIKYNINALNKEINSLEGEIENLYVALDKESKSQSIEEKAINELGMKYPTKDETVYISTTNNTDSDLAMLIKNKINE